MASKHLYTIPDMKAADRLAQTARYALEAARERAPDQRKRAEQLFRVIYGPLPPRPTNGKTAGGTVG